MATENFTTFDETDEDGDITINDANTITVDTIRRDALSHVSKSYSPYFGNFEHKVKVKMTGHVNRSLCGFWGIANAQDSITGLRATNDGFDCRVQTTTIAERLTLEEHTGSNTDFYAFTENVWYWLKIKRDGNTLTVEIYTDEFITKVDTLLLAGVSNTTFEYVFAVMSFEIGTFPTTTISFIVEDLNLQLPSPADLDFPLNATKGKGYKYREIKDKKNYKYLGTKGEDYKYKVKRQR